MNIIKIISFIILYNICFPFKGNSFVNQHHNAIWYVSVVKEHPAYDLFGILPPGNYSGITYMGDNLYALVSDKGNKDGIHLLNIQFNKRTGSINKIQNLGFQDCNEKNNDFEDLVFVPNSNTIFIASEATTIVREFNLSSLIEKPNLSPTGRQLKIPTIYEQHIPNKGLETLAYNSITGLFWTTSESTICADLPTPSQPATSKFTSPMLRFQSFTSDLQPALQYAYLVDSPSSDSKSTNSFSGVSAITAADNGLLFVMEREVFIPRKKIGAWCTIKIYVVNPQIETPVSLNEKLTINSPWMKKTLLWQKTTRLNLFCHTFANYEGMCLGPKLENGTQLLLLVSDSQNQYRNMLTDWLKPIVVRMDEK